MAFLSRIIPIPPPLTRLVDRIGDIFVGSQGGKRRLAPQSIITFIARGIRLDLEQRVKIYAPITWSVKVTQLVGNEWKL